MRKQLLLLKSLLVVAMLGVGTSAWADTNVLYGRAVTADAENGISAWNAETDIAEGAWTGSTFYAAVNTNGLVIYNQDSNHATTGTLSNASQGITNTSITAPQTNSTLTYDIVWDNGGTVGHNDNFQYLYIGNNIKFKAYAQAQKGEVVIGSNTITVPNACNNNNGNRQNDVWTIHMVVNTATNMVTELTIKGSTGTNKVNYTLDEAKSAGDATFTSLSLGWNRGNYRPASTTTLRSIKITEETSSETYADYTVHFVDNNGATVKEDAVRSGVVGSTVKASGEDKENYYTTDNKYVFLNDGNGVKVADGGTAEMTVTYTKYGKYAYTINAVDGSSNKLKELATGSYYANDAVSYAYPEYVNVDGTLYSKAAISSVYGSSFDLTSDNQVVNLTYSPTEYTGVVYYSEAEDISGMTADNGGQGSSRSSNCYGAYAASDVEFTTLTPGKYKIRGGFCGNSGTTFTIMAGEETVWTVTTNGSRSETSGDEFSIYATTALIIKAAGAGGNNSRLLDNIIVMKTGDATVSRTITSAKYATYCSPYALDFSGVSGLKAYIAVKNGSDIEFTQVSDVPANTGVLLKGDAGNYAIPVIAESTTDVDGNKFVGVTQETADVAAGIYVLLNGASGVGFYKTTEAFTVGANTAYLPATVANAARKFIAFDGGATAIKSVKSQQAGSDIYNLQGQRVKAAKRGLYIVNGKKVIK